MTVFLIILACIILLLAALLMLQGSIIISYKDQLSVWIKVLFVKISLIPKKQEKIDLRKFSYKNYQKMLAAEKAKKEKKSSKQGTSENKSGESKSSPDILGNLGDITALVRTVISCFLSHLRIDVCRFKVTVGGNDAAETALTYGLVAQSVAYIMEMLANVTHFKRKKNELVEVNADFLSDKTTVDIKVVFRVRVAHILHIGFKSLSGFLSIKDKLGLGTEKATSTDDKEKTNSETAR